MTSVVVGDPGGLPELRSLADGLARAGLLRELVVPLDAAAGDRRLVRALPPRGRTRVRAELARRRLPAAVEAASVSYAATAAELATVAGIRAGAPAPVAERLVHLRNRRFDRRLATRVGRDASAVVASYGAALETLRHARRNGVEGILSYPISHHRHVIRLLREEALRRPDLAPTLRYHRELARVAARLDAELAAADRVLVFSRGQAATLVREGVPEQKLALVPLGVDADLFRPQPRLDDGIFRVLFVGQIGHLKGLGYLLDAVDRAGISSVELVLVGRVVGSDAVWRRRAHVRHVPHRPRWGLPSLYAQADVFVLPSLAEGFPQTPLEAMACAVPAIVSEGCYGGDVVDDGVNGYVVPIRDADAIAERLRELHRRPDLRRRLGAAARATAEARTWRDHGDRCAALLHPQTEASA